MPLSSKIFSAFRALGFCSNHIPLCVRYHSKHQDNYVVTCVGTAFHTYNVWPTYIALYIFHAYFRQGLNCGFCWFCGSQVFYYNYFTHNKKTTFFWIFVTQFIQW
jgi:hypothetical protein